jgi:hypothetical protein
MPTIKEKVKKVFQDRIGEILREEIIDLVLEAYPGTNRASVIPSNYCYNMVTAGIDFDFHLFEALGEGRYRLLGLCYPYTGAIYWEPMGENREQVGEWEDGRFRLWQNDPQRTVQKGGEDEWNDPCTYPHS